MASSPRILALAGSNREQSFNRRLLNLGVQLARSHGATVDVLDLRDYSLPIMDEDLEAREGIPDNAMKLKKLFIDHDALLIACPEYNSSITPLLKNTIDWVSRPVKGEPPLAGFQGKPVTLLAASGGELGGLRGLVHVRAILGNIGAIVLPDQVAVPKAHEAFESDGSLKNAAVKTKLETAIRKLVTVTSKLAASA
ncbi:MAG: NAD(P)H-dependent FMN reductase [Phycisphaerales bacterium]|nr:NAD(P)H-dependent FMN reductase [Phycisphaerales bacterium]